MGKKPHLSMADVDSLTFEDSCLFHDIRGRAHEAPIPLAPLADTHGHLGSIFSRRKACPVEPMRRLRSAF